MPQPNPNESKEDYISRFMSSEEAKKSFPDNAQRLAVAESLWKKHYKSKSNEVQYLKMSLNELISEHEKLTKVLLEDNPKEIMEEYQDQKKELEHYIELKKKGKSNEIVMSKVHEINNSEDKVTYFYLATTLPIRKGGVNYSGEKYDREAFSKKALDNIANMITDTSKLGGDKGSYRTLSLFHDRVYAKDPTREEAGFILPEAVVEPLKEFPGHFGVKVPTKVNKMYIPPPEYPDYTPEKISYKIDNGAMGLSIEYDNTPTQEKIVEYNGERINVITEVTDFRGAGYARPNMIADPQSVKIQEIGEIINNIHEGEITMTQEEMEAKLRELKEENDKLKKDAEAKKKKKNSEEEDSTEDAKEDKEEDKKKKSKEREMENDQKTSELVDAKVREIFSNITIKGPLANSEVPLEGKAREMSEAFGKKDFTKMREIQEDICKSREAQLKVALKKGIDFSDATTLKVRCKGRGFEVYETAKTREIVDGLAKTRDVIDANDMNESTLYQTNAMFADRYVMDITETFLKSDVLLKAMLKVPHMGGNDQFQWKVWTEFGTFTSTNTAAVDPNTISVSTTERDFIKLQTPLREYRDAVEVTDWTKAMSIGVVDLMNVEINRAAEYVTNSMNADLFKPYGDATTGWKGFTGLLYIADSATYTSYGGKTRSAANRLLDGTIANTYLSTVEGISLQVVRSGYEKVLAHGSQLSDLVIVTSPTQVRRLFDSEGAGIRYNRGELSMGAAPASWGFDRAMIPYVDGIPVIRDYYCTNISGGFDTFAVVDLGPDGFIMVVAKPLGMTGLAKVGTSEKAYVSFWGQSVYKRPRNIFLHDKLLTA